MNQKLELKQPKEKYGENKLAINKILNSYSKRAPNKVINLYFLNLFKYREYL